MRATGLWPLVLLAPGAPGAPPEDAPTHVVRLVDGQVSHCIVKERRADRIVAVEHGLERHFLHTLTDWVVERRTFHEYEGRARVAMDRGEAVVYAEVGEFCSKAGMRAEAAAMFERALRLDPDHPAARAAMGWRHLDGKWVPESEWRAREGQARFEGRWIPAAEAEPARAKAQGRARTRVVWLDWTWTFADDLDPASHDRYRRVVAAWAERLWVVGEGNFALRSVKVVDRQSTPGDLHTPAGAAAAHMIRPGSLWARVVGGKVMEIPGYCDAYTWLHELGHRLFGTPEEYDTTPGCPCVESTGKNGGAWRWCDERTHIDAQREQHLPCWEGFILVAYPKAQHPGPGGKQPECTVTFQDR